LIGTGESKKISAGTTVLHHSIENWPEITELAMAYFALADAYWKLNKINDAQSWFEKCLSQERDFPNVRTQAASTYPEFIVLNSLKPSYNKALELVERTVNSDGLVFTDQRFTYHAVRSIIFNEYGKIEEARKEAQAALELSKVANSGLRYHQKVGLVDPIGSKEILKRVKALAK